MHSESLPLPIGVSLGRGISRKKIFFAGISSYLPHGAMLNVVAAGILIKLGLVKQIVFTGGKTQGQDWFSEAAEMKRVFIRLFRNVDPELILVEPCAIDTLGNIENMFQAGLLQKDSPVILLTVRQHLRRSQILFRNIANMETGGISSQDLILEHGTAEQKKYVRQYQETIEYRKELVKEWLLRIIVKFDPQGKGLRRITSRTRV
ncbi:MAG TPA: YdcF family protein [Candidatus Paceibacterota bacterium]|nr:YdcF family protein [Candidatus Paceibacterota bacterium]